MTEHALTGGRYDYDPLVARARAARVTLIGEASHGTHEFYRERARLTERLITEAGYTAVAIEGDWPDAYRANLFVRGDGDDETPEEALSDFRRFPAWMWRNLDVVEFLRWLRRWNDGLPARAPKVGFYGLDLYSLRTSMAEVVAFLERVDPDAAARARERYACFDHFGPDPQAYAYQAGFGAAEPCEQAVLEQLLELLDSAAGPAAEDRFYAEQNARLVVDAEEYYRTMFRGGAHSWNLRDEHMAQTLEDLIVHLEQTQGATRVVVWAHNSHVGDARATKLGEAGELNVGQLARERHDDQALLVGFSTYSGTVTAASDWGEVAERKHVRRALPGSWEELFHRSGRRRFLLHPVELPGQRIERAIGVVYRPETERRSHYFEAQLARQFDALVHIDETRAVEPIERTSVWEAGELPDTYPWAV
jgi:erythromycin esterase-like protein